MEKLFTAHDVGKSLEKVTLNQQKVLSLIMQQRLTQPKIFALQQKVMTSMLLF